VLIDFDKHRNLDGEIDLTEALFEYTSLPDHDAANKFLYRVMDLSPIKSRQAAAVAIAAAVWIGSAPLVDGRKEI